MVETRAAVASYGETGADIGVNGRDAPSQPAGNLMEEIELFVHRRGSVPNGPSIEGDALSHAARVAQDRRTSTKMVRPWSGGLDRGDHPDHPDQDRTATL